MLVDARRNLIVPGNYDVTLAFCVDHFIKTAKQAIEDHGAFFVALSGGATPKAIFERLSNSVYSQKVDWSKVHLFWGDERATAPDSLESNYHMAMTAGLDNLPIPKQQIHRMCAESEIEKNALLYEEIIQKVLKGHPFDLIMLGMGEDGHTASLFPKTEALEEKKRLVVANYVPQKDTWRMTLTFPCINQAKCIVFYVLGASKKEMLERVLSPGEEFPSQRIGTPLHPALWIADDAAAVSLELS